VKKVVSPPRKKQLQPVKGRGGRQLVTVRVLSGVQRESPESSKLEPWLEMYKKHGSTVNTSSKATGGLPDHQARLDPHLLRYDP